MIYYVCKSKRECGVRNHKRGEQTMAKETKKGELTVATVAALEALKAVGGSATLAELKANGANVASANLTSLVKNGLVEATDVEVEYVAVKTVKKYTVK